MFLRLPQLQFKLGGEQGTPGDSQGRAHLKNCYSLEVISHLICRWRTWLPLTAALGLKVFVNSGIGVVQFRWHLQKLYI